MSEISCTTSDRDATLSSLIRRQANVRPEAPAILAPGRQALTYRGLWQLANTLNVQLRSVGASPSARVALVLPNGPELAVAFLSVAGCATCVPLNPNLTPAEFHSCVQGVRAQILLIQKGANHEIFSIANKLGMKTVEIEPILWSPAGYLRIASVQDRGLAPEFSAAEDIALMIHTSGTTTSPKVVGLSNSTLVAASANFVRNFSLRAHDRCMNVMPLYHSHGLRAGLLATLASGGSVVCTPGFDACAFVDWIAEFRPTWYTAVPTIHQSVIKAGESYRERAADHHFRFIRSTSAPLPVTTLNQLEELTGAPVIESYGMTERSLITTNPLPPGKRKAGSVGIPAGIEVALMDDLGNLLPSGAIGEIVIRGSGVFAGYENNPEANARAFIDGWFRTGDEGRFDEEGYLYITGRRNELVNRGGYKVSPHEVDEAMLEHPLVADAAAFGIPHSTLGEDLVAAVVLRTSATVDELKLYDFLQQRMVGLKVPSTIIAVDAIPRTPTGKVQRASLHETLRLSIESESAFVQPRTETEQSIASIFREVLGCHRIGANDNFFTLGGDSLQGARVIARIIAQHGTEMPVTALFRHPTVSALAAEIDEARSSLAAVLKDELAAEIDRLSDDEVARLLADDEELLEERSPPRSND